MRDAEDALQASADAWGQNQGGERPPPLAPGEILDGKYRIAGLLGAGAMGLVFEAEHLLLDKTVAVKVLRPELTANDDLRRRFEIEARAAAAVAHPNVVTVTDMGRTPTGAVYFVMDRLVGETVGQRLDREGPMDLTRAAAIAREVLDGLEAAHARGLIHRDLKLENVFLAASPGSRERVKILDFGVAKVLAAVSGEPSATRTGVLIGTPDFMAPEQARADKEIDARVDLYALGVMLYRMLSGRAPFGGDTAMAVLAAVLTETPTDLAVLRPDLPLGVSALVMAALARDRDRRPRSAAEFRQTLESACAAPSPDPTFWNPSTANHLVPLDADAASGSYEIPEEPPVPTPVRPHVRRPTIRPAPAAVEQQPFAAAPAGLDTHRRDRPRGQLAPGPESGWRFQQWHQLRRGGVTLVVLLVAWGMWRSLDLATPVRRTLDRTLPAKAAPSRLPVVPAELARVTVRIDVAPPGTQLELDGDPLSQTRFELMRSTRKHTLRAMKDGFEEMRVDFVADDSKTIMIRLNAAKPVRRRKPR